ncbi:MAG: phenylacetate-CoA oxygenase subunit PaaC [Sphingobacteriales bacterium]|jgi:ring-1,2-phenylacetyl-CoA epoxidase subunit PaaC|nr:phenylacetate-CoA oxygenase subunit PaaC [Sphingobacteriales bacterium]MBP9140994.1 phenylacetate-CoA oxygenase subunit PaaC [Chitinophagales bacterium]MDA0198621.1 phenylacetate-CoA oxygenase subunit PaaC [Bacteroidota bacterium]MBK7527213.1 phenylacetate-CoA oxygenase subunit PaaC [Sphingobacteriales bacterium]MBK8678440.1 phenylacetate-CoA oxygenase subunit PaaC [Sphingobacteriales bacterium]
MQLKNNTPLALYCLRLADDSLIAGHMVSQWCGHGPVLEQDIALINMSLDLLGQARNLYQYCAELNGGLPFTEDTFAYHRDEREFYNHLLVELPNGDFAHTIARQLFLATYQYYLYQALSQSTNLQLAAIAQKSVKETAYHLRYTSEWAIRLGDGTNESHTRMQQAIDAIWPYTGELFTPNKIDQALYQQNITPNLEAIATLWQQHITSVFNEATLIQPSIKTWMQKGGIDGVHTEYLGPLLAEMQYLQRAHPGANW